MLRVGNTYNKLLQ